MRNNLLVIWAALLLGVAAIAFVSGCNKSNSSNKKTYTYTIYRPVYQLKQSVLNQINGNSAEPIDSLGKIYIKGNYIYLSDVNKGIHVIDNTDPSHPVQTAFLNIPGNEDIAIKGNNLFADMYADLLAIDISDLHKVKINSMLPALFTDREMANGYYMDSTVVIVSWIKKDTTVSVPDGQPIYLSPGGPVGTYMPAADFSSNSQTGVAGSTAKMVLINDYLYAITEMHTLGSINVTNPASPTLASNFFAGFDLETIYPFKNELFLGSDIGTFMYDLSNPANPTEEGEFKHGQACDPVITDGTNAYITLHAGTYCGGDSNELDVVNVQNLAAPFLVRTYPMVSPTGLSKDGNWLFVCDGTNLVKVFDASQPQNLLQVAEINVNGPYDVIAANHIAMVITPQGLYQYDYSDINQIRLLSFYAIK